MKTSTLIIIVIVAVVAAYIFGRYLERLATVQSDVCDIKSRLIKLEDHKMRGEARWEWVHRLVSNMPIIKGFLTYKS